MVGWIQAWHPNHTVGSRNGLPSERITSSTDGQRVKNGWAVTKPDTCGGRWLTTFPFADGNGDRDEQIATLKVYIRSVYRAHRFTKLKVEEKNGRLTCTFSFQFTDIKESDAPIRRGSLTAIPSVNELKSQLPSILDDLSQSIGEAPAVTEAGPLNMLHTAIHLRKPNRTNSESERSMSYSQFLRKSPLPTFIFPECLSYKEDPLRGNMRPTFHHLLECG